MKPFGPGRRTAAPGGFSAGRGTWACFIKPGCAATRHPQLFRQALSNQRHPLRQSRQPIGRLRRSGNSRVENACDNAGRTRSRLFDQRHVRDAARAATPSSAGLGLASPRRDHVPASVAALKRKRPGRNRLTWRLPGLSGSVVARVADIQAWRLHHSASGTLDAGRGVQYRLTKPASPRCSGASAPNLVGVRRGGAVCR